MITVTVVYSADELMSLPLAASIASAIANFRDHRKFLEVIVVDGGLSAQSVTRLFPLSAEASRFRFRRVIPDPDSIKDLGFKGYNLAALRRLELPDLLPDNHRVIYLDADTIVQDDLSELWDETQGDGAIWARQDWMFPDASHPYLEERRRWLGMRPGDPYFNSGVLVLDLDVWRKEDLSARVMTFLRANGAYCPWPDQDALNAVFRGRWNPLSARWNRYPAELSDREARGIIHFIGAGQKPWIEGTDETPARQIFQDYVQRTEWRTVEAQ